MPASPPPTFRLAAWGWACVGGAALFGVFLLTREWVRWDAAILATLTFGLVLRAMFLLGTRPPFEPGEDRADRAERRWWLGWFWVMLAGGPGVALLANRLEDEGAKGNLPPWLDLVRPLELDLLVMGILGLSALGAAGCLIRALVRGQSRTEFLLLVLFCSVALCFAQALALFLLLWGLPWVS